MSKNESISEGLVTTLASDGTTHIAPMGPFVDDSFKSLRFRPYQTSQTFANLRRTRQGVFHVTDDVLLLARAAVGRLESLPPLVECEAVEGRILEETCRWYAFRVTKIDAKEARSEVVAEIVDRGRNRDFFGFNRAKHAVVEAAILATRIGLIPTEELLESMEQLAGLVKKTAGDQEREAFRFLLEHIHHSLTQGEAKDSGPFSPPPFLSQSPFGVSPSNDSSSSPNLPGRNE